jgi:hypothetical protein
MLNIDDVFKGRHFDREIIAIPVGIRLAKRRSGWCQEARVKLRV